MRCRSSGCWSTAPPSWTHLCPTKVGARRADERRSGLLRVRSRHLPWFRIWGLSWRLRTQASGVFPHILLGGHAREPWNRYLNNCGLKLQLLQCSSVPCLRVQLRSALHACDVGGREEADDRKSVTRTCYSRLAVHSSWGLPPGELGEIFEDPKVPRSCPSNAPVVAQLRRQSWQGLPSVGPTWVELGAGVAHQPSSAHAWRTSANSGGRKVGLRVAPDRGQAGFRNQPCVNSRYTARRVVGGRWRPIGPKSESTSSGCGGA